MKKHSNQYVVSNSNYTMNKLHLPNANTIIYTTFKTPSNTALAGPVMYTLLSVSSQRIFKSPPGRETTQSLLARPLSTAATTTAQAPVPQASVGPAPLSHTFIRRWFCDNT